MGLFTKKRHDAKLIKPKDAIGGIMPFIMPKRTESEVSSQVEIDITKLVEYVDNYNKEEHDFKMTYFHALTACFAKTFYNRKSLNRFIKNKCLYERNKITFAFIAKDKLSDNGEERIICLDILEKDNIKTLSHKMAIDVFKVRKEGTNSMDSILSFFTKIPNIILKIIVRFIMFLDNHGINPKSITENDTNYSSLLLSNLGSIKSNSIYHHLNEYGTNSIIATIGTIKEVDKKKIVDIQVTIDERISDGFYFVKSIKLLEKIASKPELLEEDFSKIIDVEL